MRVRCATHGDIEAALSSDLWTRSKGIPLSGHVMLAKAKDLCFALGHEDFQQGNGCLQRLEERHNIMCKNIVGEATSVDQGLLEQ